MHPVLGECKLCHRYTKVYPVSALPKYPLDFYFCLMCLLILKGGEYEILSRLPKDS
jgi:hypothetical protein